MSKAVTTPQQGQAIAPAEQAETIRAKHPKVTDQQAQIVHTLCETGGHQTRTAEVLGIDRPHVCKTLKKPHVLAYLDEVTRAERVVLRVRADHTIASLLGEKSGWLRLEAARELRKDSVQSGQGQGSNTVNVQLNF